MYIPGGFRYKAPRAAARSGEDNGNRCKVSSDCYIIINIVLFAVDFAMLNAGIK